MLTSNGFGLRYYAEHSFPKKNDYRRLKTGAPQPRTDSNSTAFVVYVLKFFTPSDQKLYMFEKIYTYRK